MVAGCWLCLLLLLVLLFLLQHIKSTPRIVDTPHPPAPSPLPQPAFVNALQIHTNTFSYNGAIKQNKKIVYNIPTLSEFWVVLLLVMMGMQCSYCNENIFVDPKKKWKNYAKEEATTATTTIRWTYKIAYKHNLILSTSVFCCIMVFHINTRNAWLKLCKIGMVSRILINVKTKAKRNEWRVTRSVNSLCCWWWCCYRAPLLLFSSACSKGTGYIRMRQEHLE